MWRDMVSFFMKDAINFLALLIKHEKMGLFDLKSIFRKIGSGIHKATAVASKVHNAIGKGLDVAKRVGNIAGNLPVVGGLISSGLDPIFSVVEGARSGLGDVLNIGNKLGEVFEGVQVPAGPQGVAAGLPGNTTSAPQPLRSAPHNSTDKKRMDLLKKLRKDLMKLKTA